MLVRNVYAGCGEGLSKDMLILALVETMVQERTLKMSIIN